MCVCVCVCAHAGSDCANFFQTCEDRIVPGLEQVLDRYMVWGWLQTEGSCFGNLQAENVFSWHPFLPESFWAISIFPQIPEHSLWVPSLTCPLQIHNEYEINRKQLKVNHSLIINKTVPDRGHISTNHKKKRGESCPISLFNINHIVFFHLNSEKDCSPLPGVVWSQSKVNFSWLRGCLPRRCWERDEGLWSYGHSCWMDAQPAGPSPWGMVRPHPQASFSIAWYIWRGHGHLAEDLSLGDAHITRVETVSTQGSGQIAIYSHGWAVAHRGTALSGGWGRCVDIKGL